MIKAHSKTDTFLPFQLRLHNQRINRRCSSQAIRNTNSSSSMEGSMAGRRNRRRLRLRTR